MNDKIIFAALAATTVLAGYIPAHAQTTGGAISAEIGATGLAATEARLASLTDPDATERFALGGVRFLGAVEHALQVRYATDINGTLAEQSGIPVLRLPLPPNPGATPFSPDSIPALFQGVVDDMAGALAALDTITDTDDVGLVIDTGDLWFDIDMDGVRSPGEGVLELTNLFMVQPEFEFDDDGNWVEVPVGPDGTDAIVVRFDTSDAAWLSAYAHLLSGISETVLALNPAEAIARVLEARAAMDAMSPIASDPSGWFSMQEIADITDVVAMFVYAMDQQPDVARSRAAHAHFLGMIEDNRTFWYRVATETDDAMEWIPNKSQTSALPIPFPEDLGPRWQAVLREAEMLLNGELLVPVWRMGDGAGVNLAAMFQNPPRLDPMGLFQGEVLVPFLEEGPLIRGDALWQFEQLVGGDAGLYMVVLN